MKLRPAWLAILTGLGLLASSAGLAATQAPASQKKEQTGKKQAAPGASLSGCIDQQEGHYVLVDDRNLSPVADLEFRLPAAWMKRKVTTSWWTTGV